MNKTYKITIVVFLFLVGLLTYMEAQEPEPLNWSPSYTAADKIPLGSYAIYDLLKDNFPKVIKVPKTPFEFLTDEKPKGVYFFVNNQLGFDDAELEKLLDWTAQGNSLFLASDAFSKNLLDTLDLNTTTVVPGENFSSKPMLNLVRPGLKAEEAYLFDKEIYHSAFIEIDSLKHTVLGISDLYTTNLTIMTPQVNYVRVQFGEGQILLHTSPQAFSNFFLLHEKNEEYLEKALGYLPTDVNLYWDASKKAGKSFQTSPLYVLLGNKTLKWAYYFTLIGGIMFILFEGKRKQRAIPIKEPLQNQTFHFTRTVAGMYIESGDYKKIAEKMIVLFLEYIRLHLRIPTTMINDEFFTDVSILSDTDLTQIKHLFKLIGEIQHKPSITKQELLNLGSAINTIKKK